MYGRTGETRSPVLYPILLKLPSTQAQLRRRDTFITAPLKHAKGKGQTTENILLHFFVWILASVREGGDPTSGPPSLSHCARRRDTGITVILVIMTILVYLVILLIWVILVDMVNLVDILYLVNLVILVILVILVNLVNLVILVILVNQVNMVELVNMTDLMNLLDLVNLLDLLQDCDEYSNI